MAIDPLYPDIAFYGAPGVGKTTARQFLEALGFIAVSVAGFHVGGVRDIVRRLYGDPAVDDRELLNRVGMGVRAFDPDAWIRPAMRVAERMRANGTPVVMDDMRGDNEWNALRARGFVMVHVTAPDAVREERLRANHKLAGSDMPFLWVLEDATRYHPDHVIVNDGAESELHEAIVDILNLERSKRA